MKRCVVIGAVELNFDLTKVIQPKDFIICADRGWLNAKSQGVKADMIVGDFDSSQKPQGESAQLTVLPIEKDDTDTYYIARYILENHFTDVLMCGVTGGKRIEHTIANIQTLIFFAQNNINATIMDGYSTIIAIQNGKIKLPAMADKFFSIFSMGDCAQGVSVKGAKYPLNNYTMLNSYPVGVSNEFADDEVEISVDKGCLLLIITQKD
ncbi:MAG: thiamine diphosphokinase [Oscillospiraceae bacterium]